MQKTGAGRADMSIIVDSTFIQLGVDWGRGSVGEYFGRIWKLYIIKYIYNFSSRS